MIIEFIRIAGHLQYRLAGMPVFCGRLKRPVAVFESWLRCNKDQINVSNAIMRISGWRASDQIKMIMLPSSFSVDGGLNQLQTGPRERGPTG
jgi:hypothetical protein